VRLNRTPHSARRASTGSRLDAFKAGQKTADDPDQRKNDERRRHHVQGCVQDVRSMRHRLGLGVRQSREWFTVSLLAQALHIGRDEVRKWVESRLAPLPRRSGAERQAADYRRGGFLFFRQELWARSDWQSAQLRGAGVCPRYVFHRSHADPLSVRGPYNKAPKVPTTKPVISDLGGFEENVAEQSA
jgi:hypothetical protein